MRALIHTINGSDILHQEKGDLARLVGVSQFHKLFPNRVLLCDIGETIWKIRNEDGTYRYEIIPEYASVHKTK